MPIPTQRRSGFFGGAGVDEGGINWDLETFFWNSFATTLPLLHTGGQLILSNGHLFVAFFPHI